MARKYKNPVDALLRVKQPKTEEHKQKISKAVNEFWATAKAQLAEIQQERNNDPDPRHPDIIPYRRTTD